VPNPLSKLIKPRYPTTALGLEKGRASIVDLDRGRKNSSNLRRAATVELSESLIRPSFDEANIADRSDLAATLSDLAISAGLRGQKKWSVTLPEATTRTLILTLDTQPGSQSELEEVLAWKMDRGFAVPVEELSISRERLSKDAQGRDRYLVIATRISVLNEYESLLSSLGWRAGLILPRHMGEAQWLKGNGFKGDLLMVSSSEDAFTAVVFREGQPLILRTVSCDTPEREDEFYRLLLFYRDRRAADLNQAGQLLSGLFVVGNGFGKDRVREIVNETLGGDLRPLQAEDLGLELPTNEISFDAIAAPAGLATLAWKV
jgi:hypothetical protein